MEKIRKLLRPHRVTELENIIQYQWYAYVTDSFFAVRIKNESEVDQPKFGLKLQELFSTKCEIIWSIGLSIFEWLQAESTRERCDECYGTWQVEREYGDHTKTDDCPECDWRWSFWIDPIECTFIQTGQVYHKARLLYDILSNLWDMQYWLISWSNGCLLYLTNWEYEWIIRDTNAGWICNANYIKI